MIAELNIIRTVDLATELGITGQRIGQYVAEHGEPLGTMIGTARVFTPAEADIVRQIHKAKRVWKRRNLMTA